MVRYHCDWLYLCGGIWLTGNALKVVLERNSNDRRVRGARQRKEKGALSNGTRCFFFLSDLFNGWLNEVFVLFNQQVKRWLATVHCKLVTKSLRGTGLDLAIFGLRVRSASNSTNLACGRRTDVPHQLPTSFILSYIYSFTRHSLADSTAQIWEKSVTIVWWGLQVTCSK